MSATLLTLYVMDLISQNVKLFLNKYCVKIKY